MDLTIFRTLLSPRGQEALYAALALSPREDEFLSHFTTLSRRFPSDLARASLETAVLRLEAASKFPFADRMYFTRQALEQASSWPVSTYRVKRYRPFRTLVDLGCSIGGDTLALAALAPTLGIDRDLMRLHIARANLQALELCERAVFLQADLAHALPYHLPNPSSPDYAFFFDPARRSQGRRVFSVHHYHPPLDTIRTWLEQAPALGVKISPGVNLDELSAYDAELEFISYQGELKEAVLWFGPLKTALRRATVLPGEHTLVGDISSPVLPVSEPRGFLYEPDPSILRAGLVTDLGVQLQAVQLDASIAYLTAESKMDTPFANCWAVEDWFPFQLKRLRSYLRQRGIGQVVVKKRGSPLEPDVLVHDLRLKGENNCVLFLTQVRGKPVVIIGKLL